jgi:ribosomal protein L37AE/L43A
MTLHTKTPVRARLVSSNHNICPQCSAHLLAPERAEHVDEQSVRHIWSCEACGYEFATAGFYGSWVHA